MDSSGDGPSPTSATEQLQSHEELRSRVEREGPSRASALLLLWSAVVLAGYVGVFLLSFGRSSGDGLRAASEGGHSYSPSLLLFPVLVFSLLASGARERFNVRKKPSLGFWIANGLIVAAFLALLIANFIGIGYPWWLNLLVPVAVFVTMAVGPIDQLRRATERDPDRWVSEPLSRPARLTTAAIGAAAGLLAASSAHEAWLSVTSIAVMLSLVATLIGWRARWGLPHTGFEWGPIHWSAFGVAMGVLFLLSLLASRTNFITSPVSIAAGVLVFLVMLLASFAPATAQLK